MISVTVFRDKYVKGFPRHPHGERGHVVPIRNAMARAYATDAHFCAYESPIARRLTRDAVTELDGVPLTAVVFDVDCDTVHGTSEPAPESWRRELREKVQALSVDHPGPLYYETRGGARVVYAQSEPTVLRTQCDAQEWSRSYAVMIAYLARRYDIKADPACADWQRLYRLPRATRDNAKRPENWPIVAYSDAIGVLMIEATHEDVAVAQKASKAFRERRVLEFTPGLTSGEGLLYHVLRARGDIIGSHGEQSYLIRCPRESMHSTGRTGDGSTLLYRAAPGGEIGAIHCMHAHCSNLRVSEWLTMFTEAELQGAREAAGIVRAA